MEEKAIWSKMDSAHNHKNVGNVLIRDQETKDTLTYPNRTKATQRKSKSAL